MSTKITPPDPVGDALRKTSTTDFKIHLSSIKKPPTNKPTSDLIGLTIDFQKH